ncbi:MAG: hypothetical protein AB1722_10765 [Pseudomonadota bacterium]
MVLCEPVQAVVRYARSPVQAAQIKVAGEADMGGRQGMDLHQHKAGEGGGIERVRLGTAEMRGTGVTELSLIASVNETVKEAISASERISLIAVNASLVAGRAGDRAAGFCVVAAELKRFSESMAADMSRWSRLIEGVVHATALGRRRAHLMYKLQHTARLSDKAKAAISAACCSSRQAVDETTLLTSQRVKELLELIDRSDKQHLRGGMIARSALIEAAYGGAMHGVLRQIAETIGDSMVRFAEYSAHVSHRMRRAVD